MKAGTLEIELLANVASLQADMERIKKSVGDMSKDVGAKVNAANDNIGRMNRGLANGVPSARMAAFGMRNMAFQVQDLGVQFATAANSSDPLRMSLMALAMQGPQIRDAFNQTGMSVAGMAKHFVKAHPILAALSVAAGVAAIGFKQFQGAIDDGGKLTAYANNLGLTKDEMAKLSSTSVTFGDVMRGVWKTIYDGLDLGPKWAVFTEYASAAWNAILKGAKITAAGIYAGFAGTINAVEVMWEHLGGATLESLVNIGNKVISVLEDTVNAAIDLWNDGLREVNKIANAVGMDGFDMMGKAAFGRLDQQWGGSRKALAAGLSNVYQAAFADAMAGLDSIGATLVDNILQSSMDRMDKEAAALIADRKDKAGGSAGRAKKDQLSDAQKAYLEAVKAAAEFIAALEKETDAIGKTTIELKQMEIAAAAAAAPTDALRSSILAAGRAWEQAFRNQADQDFNNNIIAPLIRESQLLHLTGEARELRALQLEEESFKARLVADGVTDVNEAWERYLAWNERIITRKSALERDAEAARILQDELQRVIGAMSGLGGAGGALGGLLGLVSGNIGSIGGPVGSLLNMVTGTKVDKDGKVIAVTIGDEMRKIFKMDGEFGKTLTGALQSAGTGMMAGQAVFGKQGAAGQLLGGVGGILGEMAGKAAGKAIGGALGSAMGPIGSMVGGLLGTALGGLLGGAKKGSATIGGSGSNLGISGTGGNSNGYIAASTKSANAIIESLTNIASELGGTIDASRGSVSIGVRDGNYRVDTSGRGITKKKKGAIDFGEDAEAAAYFAMMDLIKDGVITGLRAGTSALLRNAKDLETGLAKALKFEGVFRELDSLKDPLGAALRALDKQFEELRKIFAEAGASAEEYAQLEELLAKKRQEVREQEGRRALEELSDQRDLEIRLLELLGRQEDALALARLAELAATKASLQPMQAMIYQLEDARAVIDQFGPLADGLRDFKKELLGNRGGAAGLGVLEAQFRATAAGARGGDAEALGRLQGVSQEFLEAARNNAGSAIEYQRAVSQVLGAVDAGIWAADEQVDYAQLTIDAIANSANIMAAMKSELATYQSRIAESSEFLARLWQRFEGDGLRVKTDSDTPLQVEVI